jgi:hypothetical protein
MYLVRVDGGSQPGPRAGLPGMTVQGGARSELPDDVAHALTHDAQLGRSERQHKRNHTDP